MSGLWDWYRLSPMERLATLIIDEYKEWGRLHQQFSKGAGE